MAGYTESANAKLNFQATGIQTWGQAANIVTGLNQGLELASKLLGQVTKSFVATGSQFEKYNVQFETLLGSADKAHKRMGELFKFASTTPFQLPDVVEAAQKLEAYGIFSERTLRAAGDAASAYGKQFNDAVEAIADAAMGEFERLKEFGIKTVTIQKHLGHELTRDTVEGLAEIRTAVVEIFEERTGGGMQRLSQTLGGMISNLQDKWIAFQKIVADAKAFDTVKEIFGVILKNVNEIFASGEAERFGAVVGDTIARAMLDATLAMTDAGIFLYDLGKKVEEWWPWPRFTKETLKEQKPTSVRGWLKELDAAAIRTLFPLAPSGTEEKVLEKIYNLFGGVGGDKFMEFGPYPEQGGQLDPAQKRLRAIRGGLRETQYRYEQGLGVFAPSVGGAGGAGLSPDLAYGPWPAQADYEGAIGGSGMMGVGFGGGWEEWREKAIDSQTTLNEELEELDIQRHESVLDRFEIMGVGWESMHRGMATVSMAWAKGEGKVLKDVARVTKHALADTLSSLIDMKTREASVKQMMAAADALQAATWNPWKAAQHVAAAAAYSAIGGIGSGLVQGFAADNPTDDSAYEIGGGDGGGGEAADGTRTIHRSVGVKTQSLVFNTYLVFNSAATFGTEGLRQLAEEEIVPVMQEALDTGALSA